jgi:hypothetical protein
MTRPPASGRAPRTARPRTRRSPAAATGHPGSRAWRGHLGWDHGPTGAPNSSGTEPWAGVALEPQRCRIKPTTRVKPKPPCPRRWLTGSSARRPLCSRWAGDGRRPAAAGRCGPGTERRTHVARSRPVLDLGEPYRRGRRELPVPAVDLEVGADPADRLPVAGQVATDSAGISGPPPLPSPTPRRTGGHRPGGCRHGGGRSSTRRARDDRGGVARRVYWVGAPSMDAAACS